MNTPSHVAAGLLLFRHVRTWKDVGAIGLGATLPDLPMFGFFAYQTFWLGRSQRELWTTLYFDPNWQLFFDLFNSIPCAALLLAISYYLGSKTTTLLVGSALLHMVCDLPVHHDDAHRHFLPLSNWRFESPISYWDPKHFGVIFAICELLFSIVACVWLTRKQYSKPVRAGATTILVFFAAAIVLAFVFWIQ